MLTVQAITVSAAGTVPGQIRGPELPVGAGVMKETLFHCWHCGQVTGSYHLVLDKGKLRKIFSFPLVFTFCNQAGKVDPFNSQAKSFSH